ncbi:MAG: HD domain-containing protein [Bacillota bacterium]|nr:HD domain-containing protein [Bacillota bacterium]
MERANRILEHPKYRKYLAKNEEAEAQRRFCHHNMGHFLDVARLAVILNETEGYGIERELIYGAALLHDVGRWMQYQDGTPHEKAGVMLSLEILEDCGFTGEEQKYILEAIGNHRNSDIKEEKSLSGLLYRADKLSRPCFACKVEPECDWKQGKKNKKLIL